jgi:hypothetical protein
MDKSTVPVEHGFANPCLSRAAHLIANVSEFREIVALIQREARGRGAEGIAPLLARCRDNGIRERLFDAFHKYRSVPDTPPVLGAPPKVDEIYGRFGKGTEVIDVGSGNCRKLKKFTGVLRITAVDPNLTEYKNLVITPNVMPFAEFFRPSLDEPIFTSFMSACQLTPSDQERLWTNDGIHLVPDHDLLVSSQVAVRVADKVIVKTPRGEYGDYPLVTAPAGVSLEPGYLAVCSFKRRDISVRLTLSAVEQSDRASIDASPGCYTDFDLGDVGWKWDGKAWELELHQGAAYLTDRAGMQAVGVTEFQQHLCLHLEELNSCYVLIRIVAFRGYIPHHSGTVLRTFAERVRLKIDGKPVVGPPIWKPGKEPTLEWYDGNVMLSACEPVDGLISRVNGKDIYSKHQWTIDVRDTIQDKLRRKLEELGMKMECAWMPGLWEYGVDRVNDTVVLKPLRMRRDKKKETTMETILYMLRKPTLTEMNVLV